MEDPRDSSQVTSKGQMVIPARLRKKYGIEAGTKVCFIERGGELVLQPVTGKFIRSVCGILESETSATRELLEERNRDRKREDLRSERRRTR